MPMFRKKPVVIEAMQFTGKMAGAEILEWSDFSVVLMGRADRPLIEITTLEGTMLADIGDWIIKGVKGEFYPCKPDIFAATYEPAEEARNSQSDTK